MASAMLNLLISQPPRTNDLGSTIGMIPFKGRKTSSQPLRPILVVDDYVIEPKKFGVFFPFLVSQVMLCLLARIPAVTVEPLFPPHPTSMTPSFGTLRSVLNSYLVDFGVTIY